MKKAQSELKTCMKEIKEACRMKPERKQKNNMWEIYNNMKTITDHSKAGGVVGGRGLERAEELNIFLSMFDTPSSSHP